MRLILPSSQARVNKLITILPTHQNESKAVKCNTDSTQKRTSDIGVQTDECKRSKRISSPLKHVSNGHHNNGKRGVSKQTQTNISRKLGTA